MPNGILSALFRSAPGILAKGMEGRRQGQMERRKIDMEDQELARAQERQATQDALAQSLMQYREETNRRQAENVGADNALAQKRLDAEEARRVREGTERVARDQTDRVNKQADYERDRANRVADMERQHAFQAQQNQLGRQARLDIGGMNQQQPAKRLPAGDADKIGMAAGLIDLTKKARATFGALPKNSGATGPVDYWVGRAKKTFGGDTPENTSARTAIANITTTLINLRSGAAVTDSEFARLRSLVPSERDDEETVRQQLGALEGELRSMLGSKLNAYEDTGYDVAKVRSRLGGGATQAPSGDDDEDDPVLRKHLQKLKARRP